MLLKMSLPRIADANIKYSSHQNFNLPQKCQFLKFNNVTKEKLFKECIN